MSGITTSLTSPTADQVEVGALLADAGPSFTVKANRSWTLNIKTTNASNWTTSVRMAAPSRSAI